MPYRPVPMRAPWTAVLGSVRRRPGCLPPACPPSHLATRCRGLRRRWRPPVAPRPSGRARPSPSWLRASDRNDDLARW